VIYLNKPSISRGCWDIKVQRYWGHGLDLSGHVASSVTWPLDSHYGVPVGVQFETIVYLARFLDIKLQRYWDSDLDLWGITWGHRSRDHWTPDMQFSIGGPLKPSLYLASLVRYCVKHLAKHIPVENALIPIFLLGVKIGGYSILQLCACSRSLVAALKLLTATIGPRSSGLVTAVFGLSHCKCITEVKNRFKIGEGRRILTPNKSFLNFRPPDLCAIFHRNRIEIATVGARTDRQPDWHTDASHSIICPMLSVITVWALAQTSCVSHGSKYRKSGNFDNLGGKTAEPLHTKLGVSIYVRDLTLTSKYGSNRPTCVVWRMREISLFVTFFSFFRFFTSPAGRHSWPILMIYTSKCAV